MLKAFSNSVARTMPGIPDSSVNITSITADTVTSRRLTSISSSSSFPVNSLVAYTVYFSFPGQYTPQLLESTYVILSNELNASVYDGLFDDFLLQYAQEYVVPGLYNAYSDWVEIFAPEVLTFSAYTPTHSPTVTPAVKSLAAVSLSGGGVAGVVVAVALLLLCVGSGYYWYSKESTRRKNFDNWVASSDGLQSRGQNFRNAAASTSSEGSSRPSVDMSFDAAFQDGGRSSEVAGTNTMNPSFRRLSSIVKDRKKAADTPAKTDGSYLRVRSGCAIIVWLKSIFLLVTVLLCCLAHPVCVSVYVCVLTRDETIGILF